MQAVYELTDGQVIAIDGKTVGGSADKPSGKQAIYRVRAWVSHKHLVSGQVKVEAKSNEITAMPELLKLLDITGCIVTIEAMGCHG